MNEERRLRETKAYAMAIGIICFSIPGATALADAYGVQNRNSFIFSYTFLLVCMILWVLQKGGID